jgi:hypothetical protein
MMRQTFLRTLLLAALTAGFADAQAINSIRPVGGATIAGTVFDSLSGTPLSGAEVQLVSADNPSLLGRSATSDSLGRYTLIDVPPARYALGFLHPMLDSLGVDVPPREVTVASGQKLRIDIGIPSPSRLRTAICGPAPQADSVGVLIGFVRNARDGSPATGSVVTGEWLEFTLGRGGLVRTIPRRLATAGDNGWFALCNVPTGGTVVLLATHGSDSTGRIEVVVSKHGFARRELFIGDAQAVAVGGDTVKGADAVRVPPRKVYVGTGRLSGVVTAAVGGRPIANATVRITDGPQVRTSDVGEWTIPNAPAGTRMLEVRAIGFYPVSRQVDIVAGAAPVRLSLSTMQAVLDTVRIIAERSADRHMSGFSGRRRSGMGTFFTAEDIARHRPVSTSEVLRLAPGVFIERSMDGDTMISMRGMVTERCTPAVYIDDHYFPNFSADDVDNYVKPNRIRGMEVYTRGSTPPQFEPGLSGCGAVVIWTK